tara:strand:+ start:271 stop:1005 length:735 start_codon:yes stop_codon:yes gene_type:complete
LRSRKPNIIRLGDRAVLLEWDFEINEKNLFWLLNLKELIIKKLYELKVEVINTYNSILISYVYSIEYVYDADFWLNAFDFNEVSVENIQQDTFILPVCYDLQFGIDLNEISIKKDMEISEIINLHTASDYTLYFMGFLPGFLYLGGMDDRLAFPRKNQPRKSIEKGAVGIAENQTGIYPKSSPAGWQIIGNCPVPLFNPKSERPSPFSPGDKIKFNAVSLEEYLDIKQAIKQEKYELKKHGNND